MVNQSSPVSESLETVLFDIELPISPDFNWFSVLQTSVYWGAVLLILLSFIALFVMFKTRHQPFAKQSLLLHFLMARRQLSRLQKTSQNSVNQTVVSKSEINGFYQLVQRLIYVSNLLKIEEEQICELLQCQADLLTFSKHTVSRETFLMNLKDSEAFLYSHLNAKNLLVYYFSLLNQKPFKGSV